MKSIASRRFASATAAILLSAAMATVATAQSSRRSEAPRPERPKPPQVQMPDLPAASIDAPVMAPGKLTFSAAKTGNKGGHTGTFERWQFTEVVLPDGGVEGGKVSLAVDLSSVKTDTAKLDTHLKTPDFFDVAQFPMAKLTFTNAKPVEGKENTYTAEGEAEIHGVKAPVATEFTVTGEDPLTVKGTATLDRSKFGVGQPHEAGNEKSILNEVPIAFETPLVAKSRAKVDRAAPKIMPVMPAEPQP